MKSNIKKVFLTMVCAILSIISNAQLQNRISVYFETSKYTLIEQEYSKLLIFFDSINKTNNRYKFSILGFCDERGSKEPNYVLSLKRANYISDLCNQKLDGKQIILPTVGKGEVQTTSSDIDKAILWKHNRRVDILYQLIQYMSYKSFDESLIVGDKIIIPDILFHDGSKVFLKESYSALFNLYEEINKRPNYTFQIQGHICCADNSADTVQYYFDDSKMSVLRAKEVCRYLINKGINPNRLSFLGYEALQPTGKGPKYDRRVEVQVVDIK